ncbi:hypothetical protein Fuma_01928 [Fuerstiella marisgermanici]|uniref:Uncharacterized protein n=1 Tax=Fuerstiella marisgermanici TaxID=1891926 RepID=A0A1P8WE20_9PLAN|nr:hypothetical protein Fuma_01928 [Fuerstiella marisgermanici]
MVKNLFALFFALISAFFFWTCIAAIQTGEIRPQSTVVSRADSPIIFWGVWTLCLAVGVVLGRLALIFFLDKSPPDADA